MAQEKNCILSELDSKSHCPIIVFCLCGSQIEKSLPRKMGPIFGKRDTGL